MLLRSLIEFESPVLAKTFGLLVLKYFIDKSLHLLNSDGSINSQNLLDLSPDWLPPPHLVSDTNQIAEFWNQINEPRFVILFVFPGETCSSLDHGLLFLSDGLIIPLCEVFVVRHLKTLILMSQNKLRLCVHLKVYVLYNVSLIVVPDKIL